MASESQTPSARDDAFASGPAMRGAGYLLEVDMRRRAVRVADPSESQRPQQGIGPSFSILDGEAIGLTVDNYAVSEVGQYSPGKVRVRFDIAVANQLPGLALVPPALGADGAPRSSLMLFPLLQNAKLTSGATAINEDGSILVNRRSETVVEPSADWDGDGSQLQWRGYDFSGDSSCAAGSPGCTPWEALPPLLPGERSPVRMVGFDLDPTVSEFRAWLLLAADLRGDTTVVPPPPAPPGTGVPFGPYRLWATATSLNANAAAFTASLNSSDPSTIVTLIGAARTKGHKLVLNMTACCASEYLTSGNFDLAKWKARQDLFNTAAIRTAIAEAVSNGTVIGGKLIDEPERADWGTGLSKSVVDQMAAYTKSYFPTLPLGISHGAPGYRWRTDQTFTALDWIVYQYNSAVSGTTYAKGDAAGWRDAVLQQAAADGVAPAFSFNILDGGIEAARDGLWNCSTTLTEGRGTEEPDCRMTAAQVREYGRVLGPAGCALLMWRYDDEFMANPANQQAFRDVAALLASRTAPSCRTR